MQKPDIKQQQAELTAFMKTQTGQQLKKHLEGRIGMLGIDAKKGTMEQCHASTHQRAGIEEVLRHM